MAGFIPRPGIRPVVPQTTNDRSNESATTAAQRPVPAPSRPQLARPVLARPALAPAPTPQGSSSETVNTARPAMPSLVRPGLPTAVRPPMPIASLPTQSSTAARPGAPAPAQQPSRGGLKVTQQAALDDFDVDDDDGDDDDDTVGLPVQPQQRAAQADDKFEELKGRIQRVIYSTADGYAVYLVRTKTKEGHTDDITVNLTSNTKFKPNDHVVFKGEWSTYKGKPTFKAVIMGHEIPQGARGVLVWLKSGAVPGIGAKKAEKMAKHHGDNLPNVVHDAELLSDGGKACTIEEARKVGDAWNNSTAQPELVEFLGKFGIAIGTIAKIVNRYGAACKRIIEDNPWRLADDISGIGFYKADEIGFAAGHTNVSKSRLKAGLRFALRTLTSSDGHCGVPRATLLAAAKAILKVELGPLEECIDEIVQEQSVIQPSGKDLIYPLDLYAAEKKLVDRIKTIMEEGDYIDEADARTAVNQVIGELGFRRDESQVDAAVMAICNPLSVITGGPGTGKSTTQKMIVAALKLLKRTILAAAPTGVAAKRLSDVSGMSASTMHRLLKWDVQAGGFTHDRSNPLPTDRLIIDEFSMVEIKIAASFFDAVKPTSGLTIVGDVDQLPSVGAGQVLRDLIESGVIPVTRLQTVHRQAGDNTIVLAASRINKGVFPIGQDEGGNGFDTVITGFLEHMEGPRKVRRPVMWSNNAEFKVNIQDRINNPDTELSEDDERIARTAISLMTVDLPAQGFDPSTEVQILSPFRKNGLGTTLLNAEIKKRLNPFTEDNGVAFRNDKVFSVGDRIMHLRNDYEKSVFNGENGFVDLIGDRVNEAGSKEKFIRVDYAGHKAFYGMADVSDVEHSWATTVHKSQGSEYPVVIIVCSNSQRRMLNRNLIYTAVTRAKKRCIVVGNHSAIQFAVDNVDINKRFTGLVDMLAQMEPGMDMTP